MTSRDEKVPKAWWRMTGLLLIAAAGETQAQADEGIPSVIVSAERREAPLQKVPIAVTSLSGDDLTASGIEDADGLARRLPTFDLQRNSGLTTTSLRIRRVGNIGNIPTFEPAVGVFVDGAFRSRSFLGLSSLMAVDRIEVLRGPQSAMYGKNVSGGLMAVHTRKPAEELSFDAELFGGRIESPASAGINGVALDVSGPLSQSWGGGITARFAQHGHTLRNALPGGPDGNDENQLAARGQLAWSASDALDFRLLAGYLRENDEQGDSDVFLAPGAASTQVSGLLQQLGLTPACADNVPRNRTTCSVYTNDLDLEATDLTLLASYQLDNGWRLKSTSGWDRYTLLRNEDDALQLFAPLIFYRDAEKGRTLQEELTLESASDGAFTWLVGGFYYRNDYTRGDHGRVPMFGPNGDLAFNPIWPSILDIPIAVPGQLGIHDSQLNTRYISAFGQMSWLISPQIRITSSLRWQQEEKEAVINNVSTVPDLSLISAILAPETTLDGRPVNGTARRTRDTVPWSVTPQYLLSDNTMAYFTLARGSKSGGYNTGFGDAALEDREFGDESIHHYEIGLKTAQPRTQINAAAFYTRYDNYQDAAFIAAQFSVGNAQRVNLRGAELEGTFQVSDNLRADFAVSYADLEYATHTTGLCYPGRVPDGSTPGTCVLSGQRPIQAPEWETHLGLQYEIPRTWGQFFARLDWSWTDEYNTSFSADPRLVQPGYSDVSLRLGTRLGDSWEVVLWGENLLDEDVVHFDALLNLFNDASYQSYLGAPRTYGLTLRIRI